MYIIFSRILERQHCSEIGRKAEMPVLPTLGIGTTSTPRSCWGICPEDRENVKMAAKKGKAEGRFCQTLAGIPSSPGAAELFKENRAHLISESVTGGIESGGAAARKVAAASLRG